MRKIYVASSWKNLLQKRIVRVLRENGHAVYDFRNPGPFQKTDKADFGIVYEDGDSGFNWRNEAPNFPRWTAEVFRRVMQTSPVARAAFENDLAALKWADTVVAVAPFGNSTSIELGWASGKNKSTAVLFSEYDFVDAELMLGVADSILVGEAELLRWASNPISRFGKEIFHFQKILDEYVVAQSVAHETESGLNGLFVKSKIHMQFGYCLEDDVSYTKSSWHENPIKAIDNLIEEVGSDGPSNKNLR